VARREARGVRRDELVAFVTDVASRVRWTVTVATGVLTRATAPVGRIIEVVRAHGGAGFALARLTTEASAVALPVDQDLARRLRVAAISAGLHFHDYVVVADADWCGAVGGPPLVLDAVLDRLAPYDARAGPAGSRPSRRQLS
jgi:hypothetical protein